MKWDPEQYLKFANHRLRPGLDLLAHLPPVPAERAIDLGCGAGGLTLELAARLPPGASLTGFDLSAEMLATAQTLAGADNIGWQQGDIAAWREDAAYDVIYSNATLHWLPDHAELFPRLMAALRPGGVLAVQMPRNFAAPSHELLRQVVQNLPTTLHVPVIDEPVAEPAQYFDWLGPHACSVDIWQTEYLHQLRGPDAVLNWVRGTTLRPVLAQLPAAEAAALETDYAARLRAAYPLRADGTTLFAFRRLFLVARKP